MALTKARVREILSEAGVDKEHMSDAVEKIIDGHSNSIAALREEVDTQKALAVQFKADAEKLPGVQKELDALKAANADSWKAKFDALQTEYDNYKGQIEAEKTLAEKQSAYRELLKDSGIAPEYQEKVLKYTDLSGVELDGKGKIKGAAAALKAVREEWPMFLESTEEGSNIQTPNPPESGGTGKTMTREEILDIKDTAERQKAIGEHLELFESV